MSIFQKSESTPAELKSLVQRGDQLLAWARHNGGLIAVTKRHLISIDHHETNRIPWELTLQAKWDEPLLLIVLQGQTQGEPIHMAWTMDEPGEVPSAVRDRVTAAVLVDQVREVQDIGRVRFIARRGPDTVSWIALPDNREAAGTDIGAQRIREGLAEIQSIFGI